MDNEFTLFLGLKCNVKYVDLKNLMKHLNTIRTKDIFFLENNHYKIAQFQKKLQNISIPSLAKTTGILILQCVKFFYPSQCKRQVFH